MIHYLNPLCHLIFVNKVLQEHGLVPVRACSMLSLAAFSLQSRASVINKAEDAYYLVLYSIKMCWPLLSIICLLGLTTSIQLAPKFCYFNISTSAPFFPLNPLPSLLFPLTQWTLSEVLKEAFAGKVQLSAVACSLSAFSHPTTLVYSYAAGGSEAIFLLPPSGLKICYGNTGYLRGWFCSNIELFHPV